MPGGYRITQSGDLRVTRAGDARITQQFKTASVGLTAAGGLSSVGLATRTGGLYLASASGIVAVGKAQLPSQFSRSASATTTINGYRYIDGLVALAASSAFTSECLVERRGGASLSGAAALSAAAVKSSEFAAALDASAALAANARILRIGSGALSSHSAVTAHSTASMRGSASLVSSGSSLSAALRLTFVVVGVTASSLTVAAADRSVPGEVNLSAQAASVAMPRLTIRQTKTLAATGIALADGKRQSWAQAGFSSYGATMAAIANNMRFTFEGGAFGLLAASAYYLRTGEYLGSAISTILSGAQRVASGSASLSSTGVLVAKAGYTRQATAALGAILGGRITQAGDRRITADGAYRIFAETQTSSMQSLGELIPTLDNVAIRLGGSWMEMVETYAKVDGEWKRATKIYAKTNGVWKLTR